MITSKGIKCSLSELIIRDDTLSHKGIKVNQLLNNKVTEGMNIIRNENITVNHLNRSKLHLNHRGVGVLAHNIIKFIKDLKFRSPRFSVNQTEASKLNSENASLSHSSKNSVKRIMGGGLKVCCLNVNSLLKHIDQLRLFCATHKPHVLCLNETKLDNEIRDEDLVIESFHSIYRKDRDRHGGGVAMFISEQIKFLKR